MDQSSAEKRFVLSSDKYVENSFPYSLRFENGHLCLFICGHIITRQTHAEG